MDSRVHKNSRQLPPRALSFEEKSSLVKFIENHAQQNAILLPDKIPGYKRDDLKLLPSSTSKKVHGYLHITEMLIKFFRLCGISTMLHPRLLGIGEQLTQLSAATGGNFFLM